MNSAVTDFDNFVRNRLPHYISENRVHLLIPEKPFKFPDKRVVYPFLITKAQMETIHGVDENIDLSTLVPGVEVFRSILQTL